MNKKAVFTICSKNYLGQAMALRKSFLEFHSDVDFFLVLMDKKEHAYVPESFEKSEVLWAEDLPIKDYWKNALKFDIIEWSTNVKPFAAQMLLEKYEKVLYLDPDLYFYRNIEWIFQELDHHSMVVTPHATQAPNDDLPQGDLEWMRVGTFNLGFIGLKSNAETRSFLSWWGSRSLSDGYADTSRGIFVDQKWVTLAVGFYPGIKILFNKGINVATWNFHERSLASNSQGEMVFEDGSPLYFFHFSGFDYQDPDRFSKRQTRWVKGSRPDLEKFAFEYKKELENNRFMERISTPYTNDFFENGVYITPLARRVYANLIDRFPESNPFSEASSAYQFLSKNGLVNRKIGAAKRLNATDVSKYSGYIRIIDKALWMAFKILGPIRYYNLMRYAAHITSLKEQRNVFDK